jgi:hypothetical protein
MKVEQFIVQYLYNNKSVSLPDIGIFTIAMGTILPNENDKDNTLPPGSIEFEYNTHAATDEGLIDFIVGESRKIRSLATSDLESYILLSNQFLNLGKPMVIDGLGTLIKNQQGTYDFTQGLIVNPKLESKKVEVKEKIQEDISFSSPAKPAPSKKGLMLLLLAFFILSVGAALYYFLVYNENKTAPITTETAAVVANNDTASGNAVNPVLFDTTSMAANVKDSLPTTNTVVSAAPNDGYTFKVQIKEYETKDAADKAYNRLTGYGHKLLIRMKADGTYQVLMPFNTALSDTARAKDSVRILFGGKPLIALN